MSHFPKKFKIAIAAVKCALAALLVGVLIAKIQGDAGFTRLYNEPKDWTFLILAQGMVLVAFTLSFIRWYLLVRGLDLRFSIRDAFRLGSLGFMLNQVMPGSVGGDLFKAAFIAHEQPGYRTEAVASVFIDRFVGLVAMLCVASIGLMFADPTLTKSKLLESLEIFIWLTCSSGLLILAILSSRLISNLKLQIAANNVPVIGKPLRQLVRGLSRYRSRRRYLIAALALGVTTHSLLVGSFWCVSQGLPIIGPTFQQNATIVPLALVAGAMPLTPGGLGVTEAALAKLYGTLGLAEADGAIVALGYRALTYVVATIGAIYYLSARRRNEAFLADAEILAEESDLASLPSTQT